MLKKTDHVFLILHDLKLILWLQFQKLLLVYVKFIAGQKFSCEVVFHYMLIDVSSTVYKRRKKNLKEEKILKLNTRKKNISWFKNIL